MGLVAHGDEHLAQCRAVDRSRAANPGPHHPDRVKALELFQIDDAPVVEDGEVDGLAGFISKPPHGGHRLSAKVELRQGGAGQSERGAAQTVFGPSVGCQVTEPHQVGDQPIGRAWGQARRMTYLAQGQSGAALDEGFQNAERPFHRTNAVVRFRFHYVKTPTTRWNPNSLKDAERGLSRQRTAKYRFADRRATGLRTCRPDVRGIRRYA